MTHAEDDKKKVASEVRARIHAAVNYIRYVPRVSFDKFYNNLINIQFISLFDRLINYTVKEK